MPGTNFKKATLRSSLFCIKKGDVKLYKIFKNRLVVMFFAFTLTLTLTFTTYSAKKQETAKAIAPVIAAGISVGTVVAVCALCTALGITFTNKDQIEETCKGIAGEVEKWQATKTELTSFSTTDAIIVAVKTTAYWQELKQIIKDYLSSLSYVMPLSGDIAVNGDNVINFSIPDNYFDVSRTIKERVLLEIPLSSAFSGANVSLDCKAVASGVDRQVLSPIKIFSEGIGNIGIDNSSIILYFQYTSDVGGQKAYAIHSAIKDKRTGNSYIAPFNENTLCSLYGSNTWFNVFVSGIPSAAINTDNSISGSSVNCVGGTWDATSVKDSNLDMPDVVGGIIDKGLTLDVPDVIGGVDTKSAWRDSYWDDVFPKVQDLSVDVPLSLTDIPIDIADVDGQVIDKATGNVAENVGEKDNTGVIPSITAALESVFVPTLDFTASIAALQAKFPKFISLKPTLGDRAPLHLYADLSSSIGADSGVYVLDATLDQPWFAICREILLGFIVLGLVYFGYRKISDFFAGGDGV